MLVSISAFTIRHALFPDRPRRPLCACPQAKRIACLLAALLPEIVIDRLADQGRARSLLFLRQFVQRLDLGIAEINQCPHHSRHDRYMITISYIIFWRTQSRPSSSAPVSARRTAKPDRKS